MKIRFLGSGNAFNREFGDSSIVYEVLSKPILMIDCGQSAYTQYTETYGSLPKAIFITHTHNDHVSGLENLFFNAIFDKKVKGKIKLFIPANIIKDLYENIGNYDSVLAEGGVNFADCFQIIPVLTSFWLNDQKFDIFPVRHMAPNKAFGICLRGSFFFSGDTRPIPEMASFYATAGEIIFHDCCLEMNPAHSDINSIKNEYTMEQINRMVFYHLPTAKQAQTLEDSGFRVAKKLSIYDLNAPTEYTNSNINDGFLISFGSNVKDSKEKMHMAISIITTKYKNVSSSSIHTTTPYDINTDLVYSNVVLYFESEHDTDAIGTELNELMQGVGYGDSCRPSKGGAQTMDTTIEVYYQILLNLPKNPTEIPMSLIEKADVPFLKDLLNELMFKLGYKEDPYFKCWRKT